MKMQHKDNQAVNFHCPLHKQKSTFVCLHKTCPNSFKIGCPKCRKDHAQHPNRLIPILDFHSMLSKPIKYLQNSTAFKLMNLKKKIEYIRNFRTSILEKELQLIESNKNIKSTIASILEEHYQIRDVVAHINTETLTRNTKEYFQYLLRTKEFLAFNPVKADLVFNNEVIKNSRVLLEKHLKTSHELTDSIRQFLVKIIEVLLANCAHEEDDEQIELDEEGDNATNFNIFIKNRIDVTENPNIKSKLENEGFLEMFDEEKDALNQEIDMLEKQLDIKVGILNRIRSSNATARESQLAEQPARCSSVSEFKIQSKVSELMFGSAETTEAVGSKNTIESLPQYQNVNAKLQELKEQYQTMLNQKQLQIQRLRESCREVELRCFALQDMLQKQNAGNQELRMTLEEERKMSGKLNQHIQQEEIQFMELVQKNKGLLQDLHSLKKEHAETVKNYELRVVQYEQKAADYARNVAEYERRISQCEVRIAGYERRIAEYDRKMVEYEGRIAEQKKSAMAELNELKKQKSLLQSQQSDLAQQLEKKQKQISRQKKRIQEIEKGIQKVKESNAHIQKELAKNKEQFQSRQKKLKNQIQMGNKDLERLSYKTKTDHEKIKHLELLNKELNKELDIKNSQLREKEKDLKARDDAYKEKNQTASLRIKFLENQLKATQNSQSTPKNYQSEQKKFKQMKQMLEISIKKNQQLKDKIFHLQTQLQDIREERSFEKANQNSSKVNIRQTIGSEQVFTPKKTAANQKNETVKRSKSIDKVMEANSPGLKKKEKVALKDKKIITNKEDRKMAYLEIKNIFKVVTEDMNLLEQRLKENNVIEKVYLKELQRKRVENKTLKKELQNVKLYGSNLKHSNVCRATSPVSRLVEKQKLQTKMQAITISSSINKAESLSGLGVKAISSIK